MSNIHLLNEQQIKLMSDATERLLKHLKYQEFSAQEARNVFLSALSVTFTVDVGTDEEQLEVAHDLLEKILGKPDDGWLHSLDENLEEFFKKHCGEFLEAIEGEPTRFKFK